MDQELKGIVDFLTERGKQYLKQGPIELKGYFIMRYPSKPKLVYSPINFEGLTHPMFRDVLPVFIQTKWTQRKDENEPGSLLIAVCTIGSFIYTPKPERYCPLYDKIGKTGIAVTVNTVDKNYAFLTFFERSGDDIIFQEAIEHHEHFTRLGAALYPKEI
jgi:hypothetical protein